MLIDFQFLKNMVCDEVLVVLYIVAKIDGSDWEVKKICYIVNSYRYGSCVRGLGKYRGYPNEESLYVWDIVIQLILGSH